MYRILEEHRLMVRERRNQRRSCPNYTKPELLAEARRARFRIVEISTKLRGVRGSETYWVMSTLRSSPRHGWSSLSLVGWMLAHRESAALASTCLIAESRVRKARTSRNPTSFTLHGRRATWQSRCRRARPVALKLLADLAELSSRPHALQTLRLERQSASSESPASSTMKYCQASVNLSTRFGFRRIDGRLFCGGFFDYYNYAHRCTQESAS